MASKDLTTNARMLGIGGTLAERTFEVYWPHRWLRSGFSNPQWSDGADVKWDLPRELTAMPDYISRNGDGAYWVECVGCSGDKVTALKTKKLELLRRWAEFTDMHVVVFVYNSKLRRWMGIWLNTLLRESEDMPIEKHSDGPTYYAWDWLDLRQLAYLEGTRQR